MADEVAGVCPICHNFGALHCHHLIPRARGGLNGPTKDICGSCHTSIHSAALSIESGRAPPQYFTEEGALRAQPFIEMIVHSKRYEGAAETELIVLNPPRGTRQKLHNLKARAGFKSLDAFILHILEAIAERDK